MTWSDQIDPGDDLEATSDLELKDDAAESVAGGKQPGGVPYLTVTMTEVFVSGISSAPPQQK